MADILVRIKRAVLAGRYAFSEKARLEMDADDLTDLDGKGGFLEEQLCESTARHTLARAR